MTIGREWLGPDHPILGCLELGVAIHHGALPTPFRKEVERLLRDAVLKITVSSPTLAQGLNLSATTVVIHSLTRAGEAIDSSEFRNVIGRAGRAYVDVEGLVLYPMFDNHYTRRKRWEAMISNAKGREMESGLLRLVYTLLARIFIKLGRPPVNRFIDYVMNNAAAWEFPELPDEDDEEAARQKRLWEQYISSLDTAVLSLLGEQDIAENDIEARLDDILASSLWERRLKRQDGNIASLLRSGLHARAKFLWRNTIASQRKGYFLAGVGYNTGSQLDGISANANLLLVRANAAILLNEESTAIEVLTELADRLFMISPFTPEPIPPNWRNILKLWLQGKPILGAVDADPVDALRFIEAGLVYRLPWGMEAVRVRALASGDTVDDGMTLADYELGLAVAAVETGTLNRSAALLMQAGFSSRLAAIKAVLDTEATFASSAELLAWLDSDRVRELTETRTWPTLETSQMWRSFRDNFAPPAKQVWGNRAYIVPIEWEPLQEPLKNGDKVRVMYDAEVGTFLVLSPDYLRLGSIGADLNGKHAGVILASVRPDRMSLKIDYLGPDDLATT